MDKIIRFGAKGKTLNIMGGTKENPITGEDVYRVYPELRNKPIILTGMTIEQDSHFSVGWFIR